MKHLKKSGCVKHATEPGLQTWCVILAQPGTIGKLKHLVLNEWLLGFVGIIGVDISAMNIAFVVHILTS